jgi:small subunit ribosomal protein S16
MVKIRLRRVGARKQPSYRIVATDSRAPRDGRFIEAIGFYNPRTEPATVDIQEDRALYWLSVGAQTSEAVERLFKNAGTLARYERLKQGEDLAVLVAEAEAEQAEPEAEAEPEAKPEAKPEAEATPEPAAEEAEPEDGEVEETATAETEAEDEESEPTEDTDEDEEA